MIRYPAVNQFVELRYGAQRRDGMPHGAIGRVLAVKRFGRGPRNHLILIAGVPTVVPAGQLFPTQEVQP